MESRQALAALAEESRSKLDESLEERGIVSLRERVVAATAELEEALAQGTRTLGPLSFKLQRTRHRGVYRSGSKYVVPYVDSVGIDRQREFSTRAAARAFRDAIQDPGEIRPPGALVDALDGRERITAPGTTAHQARRDRREP